MGSSDDGEYSDSDKEKKVKPMKKMRYEDAAEKSPDIDDDEEARLRARLLERRAEKEKEKVDKSSSSMKKSDKHHHKKKKKQRSRDISSPVELQTADKIEVSYLGNLKHEAADDDVDEGLGLNIQPPQQQITSGSTAGSNSHRKKHHKKKEKHKDDDESQEKFLRTTKEKEKREYEQQRDYESKKESRIREGWAAWKRSLTSGAGAPARGYQGRGAVGETKFHSTEHVRRNERLEIKTSMEKVRVEEQIYVARERRRGDDRRSRSPLDRRHRRISPPTHVERDRKTTTTQQKHSSHERRWLPHVTRDTASASSERSSTSKQSEKQKNLQSKEKTTNLQRAKLVEPSRSLSPASPENLATKMEDDFAQPSTPTQDELEDKETAQPEVLSEVSKSGSSDSESNGSSSSSSSPNASDDGGESLESGERRSENSNEATRKTGDVGKTKYSKFDSSSDEESSASGDDEQEEDIVDEEKTRDDDDEPAEIAVSDDEAEKNDLSHETEPISPEPEEREKEPELPVYYPAIMGCRSVEEFHCLNRIEEGTYGVVYRAREKRTDDVVALKRLKMEKEKEGFPITSLREINMLLKAGNHPNIVNVREIVVGSNMDKIYLVMDYVEHDLKSLMETMKQPFLVGEVKTLMKQLLSGVHHLHDNWILHRDLKTSNLLLSHKGILKIGDFGLAREYGSPLKPYTPIVVTLWYRSPELLLGIKEYSTPIDVWSVGCIFAELLTLKPLFTGKSEIEQLNKIFKMLGTPNSKIWSGYDELPGVKKMSFVEYPYNSLRKHFGATLSDKGFNLLNKLLTYDPQLRITAKAALNFEWFDEEPRPVPPEMFPTWPAKSELSKSTRKSSPKPPSGGKQYKQMGESDKEMMAGLRLKPGQGNTSAAGFSLKFDAPKF